MFSDMYASLYDMAEPEGDYTIICVAQIIDDKGNITFEDINVERFNHDNTCVK